MGKPEPTPSDDAGSAQEPPSPAQLVVADADGDQQQAASQVEEPARLMRIAAMVKSLLAEVRAAELDEAGRARLADVHGRALAALEELVSDDLRDELEEVGLSAFGDQIPSGPELRVAQAQLAGWLEGLFRGIQATLANQQLAARAQLAQQRASGSTSPGGQYL